MTETSWPKKKKKKERKKKAHIKVIPRDMNGMIGAGKELSFLIHIVGYAKLVYNEIKLNLIKWHEYFFTWGRKKGEPLSCLIFKFESF